MELCSMLAGEPFTDHPAAVCPVIGALLRNYNDTIDDARRQDLFAYASLAVGTRAGSRIEMERISAVLAWSETRRARSLCRVPRFRRRHDDSRSPHVAANAAIRALGKRITDDDHRSFLSLIDELCAIGADRAHDEPADDRRGGPAADGGRVGGLAPYPLTPLLFGVADPCDKRH
jgi:hypothetical protein